MKVLVADDGLTTRRLLVRYLAQWGHDVVSVANGNEAWNILKKPDTPRLMVFDWVMPGISGIDLCREARRLDHGRLLHIIIFTSTVIKENMIAALDAGADDFIHKQFDMNEFRARLQVGVRMVKMKAELAERVQELEDAIGHIKRLHGMLPICMHCHRIRDKQAAWQNLEKYLAEHSDVTFSHGLCPECIDKYFPE